VPEHSACSTSRVRGPVLAVWSIRANNGFVSATDEYTKACATSPMHVLKERLHACCPPQGGQDDGAQRSMRQARPPRASGQTWATFLRTHAADIWACDVLPVTDLLFRQVSAFFIVELAARRVVQGAVTRPPSDAWVAQHLRAATPFGQHPLSLIRDTDSTFGPAFARVAEDSGSEILRTAYRAPRMNALCARVLGSVRRECLDHLLILGEAHLRRALQAYVTYVNEQRPHQGIAQQIPAPGLQARSAQEPMGRVAALSVRGGLHHAYRRGA